MFALDGMSLHKILTSHQSSGGSASRLQLQAGSPQQLASCARPSLGDGMLLGCARARARASVGSNCTSRCGACATSPGQHEKSLAAPSHALEGRLSQHAPLFCNDMTRIWYQGPAIEVKLR